MSKTCGLSLPAAAPASRARCSAVEEWARAQGADWLGSDTNLGNTLSEAWHSAMGFREVERLVVFGKPLD